MQAKKEKINVLTMLKCRTPVTKINLSQMKSQPVVCKKTFAILHVTVNALVLRIH